MKLRYKQRYKSQKRCDVTPRAMLITTTTVEPGVLHHRGHHLHSSEGHAAHPNATLTTTPLRTGARKTCH